jgi:hypothetical protein
LNSEYGNATAEPGKSQMRALGVFSVASAVEDISNDSNTTKSSESIFLDEN